MTMNVMKKLSLYALLLSCVLALGGCSSSSDSRGDPGYLSEDASGGAYGMGADAPVAVADDGALLIGDPYAEAQAAQYPAGPQALRENNTIYFMYDSEQIQDQYVSVMQAHAQYLRDNPDSRIIIEGHTDERGTPEYNIALGERRARSVARYMQNLGVDVNQLSIVSYGEEKPAVPGHNEAAWSKNRRAVINY